MASSSAPLVLRLLAASASVSERAGAIIRQVAMRKNYEVLLKGGRTDDPQTEADRAAQRCIISSLRHQFPSVTVIGEEDIDNEVDPSSLHSGLNGDVLKQTLPEALQVDGSDVVVWVDPLDGTSEFTAGNWDNVTVLIGIAVRGRAACGVIHQPFYGMSPSQPNPDAAPGRTCWGIKGVGAYGFKFSAPEDAARRIVVSTRTHPTSNVLQTVEAIKPTTDIRVGGAGCKILMLLEGRADVYAFASPGTSKWDTCAGEALLEAVGGTLTDVCGNYYQYGADIAKRNTGGILACRKDHSTLVSLVPETVKQSMASS